MPSRPGNHARTLPVPWVRERNRGEYPGVRFSGERFFLWSFLHACLSEYDLCRGHRLCQYVSRRCFRVLLGLLRLPCVLEETTIPNHEIRHCGYAWGITLREVRLPYV